MSVLVSSALSDTGRKRRRNEDAFVCEPPLFAVADGMGGARAGEIASRLAAGSVRELERGDVSSGEQVAELIREANRRVYTYSNENASARGMGTTMTVALVEAATVTVGHVGDSRAYLLRDDRLEQLTQDHSLVAELVRSGRLSPEEAESHPQRSVITRALGTDPVVEVDVFSLQANDGDLFLLCSDGLTSMVTDEEIARLLTEARDDLEAAARRLIEAANEAGGEDNITVVLFELEVAAEPENEPEEAKTLTEADAVPTLELELAVQPHRRRYRLALLGLGLALLVSLATLGALFVSRAHFVGVEPDGHVAIYEGLPYSLPGGIHLYRPVHVSGSLLAAQLTRSERRSLFNHALHSFGYASRELKRYEEAVYP
ncbi:MAG: Stp1/IreP family PP2C-type Ser/Thr phosphatase [Gaiellaceae bacterium]|jgi:protein phosphatase